MSAVYTFPFDIKAFLADVLELTTEGQGAYLRLLLNYYQRGHGCTTSVTTLVTITGLTEEAWQKHASAVLSLFTVRAGKLYHARCEKEIAKIKSLQEQRKRAGQASGAKTRKPHPTPRQDNERPNERPNGRDNETTTSDPTPDITTLRPIDSIEVSKKEVPGGTSKEAPDGAPPAEPPSRLLDIPLPSDFSLNPEDVARCLSDAPAHWLWDVFQQWKDYHLEAGTLTSDWKAAWWRRWAKARPPAPVDPPRPKPRLVVTSGKAERKTLLPKDWHPNANNAAVCAEEGYDLDAMAQHFRDVCGANGYRYINHHQAFSNFIRNQKNFERGGNRGKTTQRGSIVQAGYRASANLDAEIREAEAAEARDRDGDEAV